MKLFLIKIGKAWHTLRREGLIRGGRRVSRAFFALFRKVGSGDVLFVTGGVGDSALYRAHHVAEELELHGISTGVAVQDNPLLPRYAEKFSVFVFHRVLSTSNVLKLIDRIKAQGKEIIFETDDLVYDPEFLKYMDYFQKMNGLEKKLYEHGVGGDILADPYVKVCTTTTTFLADKLRERGKRVIIVPNKLSQEDVAVANDAYAKRKSQTQSSDLIRIGYFSGTHSHNKDFATITEALVAIMQKYAQVRLVLAGPLDTESALQVFADRIETLPYAPRDEHFANVASVDINLAPLEIGNPFCESKSELKFFEAGIAGVSTVASATRPYREAIENGVDGFVADSTQVWVDTLSKLIEDKNLRETMGNKAREKALQKYSTQTAANEEYYTFVRSCVKKVSVE